MFIGLSLDLTMNKLRFIYISCSSPVPASAVPDIYMFADDTKVFRTVKTNDDQCILQHGPQNGC